MTAEAAPPDLDRVADELVPSSGNGTTPATLTQAMLASEQGEPAARGLRRLTGGRPVGPLLVMFALAFIAFAERATIDVLEPEIHHEIGFNDLGLFALHAVTIHFGFFFALSLAFRAEHGDRVRLMVRGTVVFVVFSVATVVVPDSWWMFLLVRAGVAFGVATVIATHLALLADSYGIVHRPKVYALHGAAMGLGSAAGLAVAMQMYERYGWRSTYLVIAPPALLVLLVARRLRDPDRGTFERRAMGASGESLSISEEPPSFEESQRMVQRIASLRRLFFAMPFLAVVLVGFGTVGTLFDQRELDLGHLAAWRVEALVSFGQVAGCVVAGVVGTRLIRRDPAALTRVILIAAVAAAGLVCVLATARSETVSVAARAGLAASAGAILPIILAALSLVVPPRARSTGFATAMVYALPGMLLYTLATGWVTDTFSVRWGVLVFAPVLVLGGVIAWSVRRALDRDVRNAWTTTAARAELRSARQRGEVKQLLVRKLDVHYGDVQILFGVDFEVAEGEIIALLGTNGAGKSTLLRAICGIVQATNGAVVFEGRDITSAPAHEIAAFGIAMVPGGAGVFPSLTVEENLKVASWASRGRARHGQKPADGRGLDVVLDSFPVLRERLAEPAGNLSGGQQQMLALGMAFISRPKLLVIDELSLGLAPVVVEQLLGIVRAIRDEGTTVILVEQSVNVALTLAETAYFMEKGEIRFHGPTTALLERPDVLRSVFLAGAAATLAGGNGADDATPGHGATPLPKRSDAQAASPPQPQHPSLALEHLTVRFGGIVAVDDVSLGAAPGEILAVIGPNGAGKTTLFDIVSGFTRPDAGRVLLAGRDITRLGPDARAREGLGRSFQEAVLFPALTVEDTLKVALERFVSVRDPFNAMLRLPAQQDSEHALSTWVDELIDLLGLDAFRSKFVRELSTGSRRIVDLACVLAHRPSVVLLDEPSSGIAQRESEALAPLIRRVRDTLGASILLIEHDMPLAAAVADRMVALDLGRVIAEGPARHVLEHPAVVASYLGDRTDVIARSGGRAS